MINQAFHRCNRLRECLLGVLILALFVTRLEAAPPAIDGFSPANGSVGDLVTITGSGLDGVSSVRFNGIEADIFPSSATQLFAFVPAGATTGPITVTTPEGSATSSGSFIVASGNLPSISSFEPGSGPAGSTVTVSGQNLASATTVTINGFPSPFSISGGQLFVVVPASATTGRIRVVTSFGEVISSTDFVVQHFPPEIFGFAPMQGPPGTTVSITGTNLATTTKVMFNGVDGLVSTRTATTVNVIVPQTATSGPIVLMASGGSVTSSVPFTVTLPLPVVDGFNPGAGGPGTIVTVTGQNFVEVQDVRIGAITCSFSVTSTNELELTVPEGVRTGPVTVTTASGSRSSNRLFYGPPRIDVLTPSIIAGGDTLVVSGINLTGATNLLIHGFAASFQVEGDTNLTLTVPDTATTGQVVVETPGGTATSSSELLVLPRIRDFSQPNGQPGDVITLIGSGFNDASGVSFNGAPAIFDVISSQEIRTLVPDNATTGPVSVTTPVGTRNSAVDFQVALELRSFSPASGAAGAEILIRGVSFINVSAVRFNGTAASSFERRSPSEILAVVPVDATSGLLEVVSDGSAIFSQNAFIILPRIESISPLSGLPGDMIVITGSGFVGTSDVLFGTVRSSFEVKSPTRLEVRVPDTAATSAITVVTAGGATTSAKQFFVGRAADLALTITAGEPRIDLNETVELSLIVTNRGTTTATNVVVTNQLPAGLEFVSAISNGSPVVVNGTISFTLGDLAPGASPLLSITARGVALGSQTNLAAVASGTVDPDLANNSATAFVEVVPVIAPADLALSVTAVAPDPGTTTIIEISLTVTNLGPGAASNVVVTNWLPAGVTVVGIDDGAPSTQTNGAVVFAGGELAAIPAGGVVELGLTIRADAPGAYTNLATVISGIPDPDLANNSASAVVEVVPVIVPADLALSVTAVAPDPGTTTIIEISLTVTNLGPGAASNVVVTNWLPAGVTVVGIDDGAPSTQTNGVIVFAGGELAAIPAGGVIELGLTVRAESPGSYTNAATVVSETPDPDGSNNTGEAPFEIVDLSPPEMRIHLAGGEVQISWAEADEPVILEFASNLATPDWQESEHVPVTMDDRRVVTISPVEGSGFFRLRRP